MSTCIQEIPEMLFKTSCDSRGVPCNNPFAQKNMRRTLFIFCFLSTNSSEILLSRKFWRNIEEWRIFFSLVDRVAISGRRKNSERNKKKFFFNNSNIVLKNNSLRNEHIFLTFFPTLEGLLSPGPNPSSFIH